MSPVYPNDYKKYVIGQLVVNVPVVIIRLFLIMLYKECTYSAYSQCFNDLTKTFKKIIQKPDDYFNTVNWTEWINEVICPASE